MWIIYLFHVFICIMFIIFPCCTITYFHDFVLFNYLCFPFLVLFCICMAQGTPTFHGPKRCLNQPKLEITLEPLSNTKILPEPSWNTPRNRPGYYGSHHLSLSQKTSKQLLSSDHSRNADAIPSHATPVWPTCASSEAVQVPTLSKHWRIVRDYSFAFPGKWAAHIRSSFRAKLFSTLEPSIWASAWSMLCS